MLSSPSSVRAAQLRAEDLLVQAGRERKACQVGSRVKTEGASQPAFITAIRYTRYLLTSLAAVAFGLSAN